MKKIIVYVIFILSISGCSSKMYNSPSSSQPHATLSPISDNEHHFSIFNDSTIFIYRINDKPTNNFWKARNLNRIVSPGKTTVYVEEDKLTAEYIFSATLSFMAEAGKTYIISSKHIKKNDRIIDIEFFILQSNQIINKAQSEKIKRGRPTYIPIIL